MPPEFSAPTGTQFVFLSNELIGKMGILASEGWYQLGFYIERLQQAGISADTLPHATGIFNLPASLVVLFVTIILVKGIRESAIFNTAIVIGKLAVILAVIVVGIRFIQTDNWVPFIPPNTGKYGEFGWSGVINRRRGCFLRLRGIRRCLNRGSGSQATPKTYADRDFRFAGPLCCAVYSVRPSFDGSGQLFKAQRSQSRGFSC